MTPSTRLFAVRAVDRGTSRHSTHFVAADTPEAARAVAEAYGLIATDVLPKRVYQLRFLVRAMGVALIVSTVLAGVAIVIAELQRAAGD